VGGWRRSANAEGSFSVISLAEANSFALAFSNSSSEICPWRRISRRSEKLKPAGVGSAASLIQFLNRRYTKKAATAATSVRAHQNMTDSTLVKSMSAVKQSRNSGMI